MKKMLFVISTGFVLLLCISSNYAYAQSYFEVWQVDSAFGEGGGYSGTFEIDELFAECDPHIDYKYKIWRLYDPRFDNHYIVICLDFCMNPGNNISSKKGRSDDLFIEVSYFSSGQINSVDPTEIPPSQNMVRVSEKLPYEYEKVEILGTFGFQRGELGISLTRYDTNRATIYYNFVDPMANKEYYYNPQYFKCLITVKANSITSNNYFTFKYTAKFGYDRPWPYSNQYVTDEQVHHLTIDSNFNLAVEVIG